MKNEGGQTAKRAPGRPSRISEAIEANVREWMSVRDAVARPGFQTINEKARDLGISRETLSRLMARIRDPEAPVRRKFRALGIPYTPPVPRAD